MRRIFCLLFLAFLLVACLPPTGGLSAPIATPAPAATATLAVSAPTASLAPSATPLATETPAPSTITPLPTIPIFTPTFDARTIVTVTLESTKAVCPTIQKDAPITLSNFGDYYPEMLDALNQGAPIKKIVDVFGQKLGEHISSGTIKLRPVEIDYKTIDVTGDGVPEILLPGSGVWQESAVIFGCAAGKYKRIYTHPYELKYLSLDVNDANRNGIPEIFIGDDVCSRTGCSFQMSVVEWHQNTFQLIQNDIGGLQAASWNVKIADIDNDYLKEISWRGGIQWWTYVNPWRLETHIYKWNGSQFVELPVGYGPPQYRFQAIQDADEKVNNHEYDQAFSLYQDAIFDDKLDWWSSEKQFYSAKLGQSRDEHEPTPTQPPQEDKTEHPRLAAYAYYRMVILHTYLAQTDAAQTQYATLQAKFPPGNPGHPYVEMATAFWDAYQSTGKMYNACGAAIAYADAHPEILVPLGSDYHGAQSHTYVPADVCPFR